MASQAIVSSHGRMRSGYGAPLAPRLPAASTRLPLLPPCATTPALLLIAAVSPPR